MATHSRILAWRIPWTEEPGGWATGHGGPKELDMTECLSAQPLLLISSVVILRHCRVLRRFCEFSRLRHEWPEKEAMAAGGRVSTISSVVGSRLLQKSLLASLLLSLWPQ